MADLKGLSQVNAAAKGITIELEDLWRYSGGADVLSCGSQAAIFRHQRRSKKSNVQHETQSIGMYPGDILLLAFPVYSNLSNSIRSDPFANGTPSSNNFTNALLKSPKNTSSSPAYRSTHFLNSPSCTRE